MQPTIHYSQADDSYIFTEELMTNVVPRAKVWTDEESVFFRLGQETRRFPGPLPECIEEVVFETRQPVPEPERLPVPVPVEAEAVPASAAVHAQLVAAPVGKRGRPKGSKNKATLAREKVRGKVKVTK